MPSSVFRLKIAIINLSPSVILARASRIALAWQPDSTLLCSFPLLKNLLDVFLTKTWATAVSCTQLCSTAKMSYRGQSTKFPVKLCQRWYCTTVVHVSRGQPFTWKAPAASFRVLQGSAEQGRQQHRIQVKLAEQIWAPNQYLFHNTNHNSICCCYKCLCSARSLYSRENSCTETQTHLHSDCLSHPVTPAWTPFV